MSRRVTYRWVERVRATPLGVLLCVLASWRESLPSGSLLTLLLGLASSVLPRPLDAADCNQNGIEDVQDVQIASSQDCNDNQIPDECELAQLRLGFTYEGAELPPSPQDVVAADLNGDGLVDFAVATQDDVRVSAVAVMLVVTNGRLSEPVVYPVAERLSSLTALDLDGDGDLDLATANSRTLEVLTNGGDGSFTATVSVPVPDGTRRIQGGDVTGDGIPDLVVANNRSGEVTVFSNLGTGRSFREGRGLVVGERPASLDVADLDGDGDLDLLVANDSSDDVAVLRNEANGLLSVASRRAFDTGVLRVLAEDFDADGAMDLAVGLRASLRVFPAIGDLQLAEEVALAVPAAVLVGGDFDGDGDTDLAAGGPGNSRELTMMINHDGAFGILGAATVEFLFVAAADVDADGDDDLGLVSVAPDNMALLLSGEDETYTVPLESSILVATEPRKPHSIATGDFDGDGRPEIATSDGHDRSVSLFRNVDGQLEHTGEVAFDDAGHLNSLTAEDLDGDGDLDLAVADREAHRLGVLINRGDGTYPAPVHYAADQEPFMVATGDLDGDGFADLLSANKTGNTVTLYRNRGDGTYESRRDLAVGAQPFAVAVGDLDDDGDLDLVTANSTAVSLSVLVNQGAGEFTAASEIPVLSAPRYVALADLDADGDLDLATADADVSVFVNRGDGSFQPQRVIPVGGGSPYSVIAVDVNADGRLDLAVVSEELSTVVLLIGEGDGTFPLQFRYWLNDAPRFVGAADLNDDGLLDLVGTNRRSRNLTVFTSQRPVVAEPMDPTDFCVTAGPSFLRGDADAGGTRNLGDAVGVLEYLFRKGVVPACSKAADANDDGRLNLLDPLLLLSFLFRDGAALPEPSAACGVDPTADGLECAVFPTCR